LTKLKVRPAAQQAALAGVKAAITALPEPALAAAAGHGGTLLPPLFAAFRHRTPDVRKATVMALVELTLVSKLISIACNLASPNCAKALKQNDGTGCCSGRSLAVVCKAVLVSPALLALLKHLDPAIYRLALQKLGSGVAQPLLEPLAPAEAKLVAIYVQRVIDAEHARTAAV
jgi:hypothetical protein